jgi:uracil-DNA glycosylase
MAHPQQSQLYTGLSDAWMDIVSPYEITEDMWTPKVFPPIEETYNALRAITAPDAVRVIILGQDPYPTRGNAHGLAFSVLPGVAIPASLKNIYKELVEDIGCPPPKTGCLDTWASQGILLLNDILTVEEGKPLSHKDQGWQEVTDDILRAVLKASPHVVLVAWGKNAQNKLRTSDIVELIEERRHTVLRAPHPSPLSAHTGFFGSRPFSKINADLTAHGLEPIRWTL